jgi:DNA invertase Pin-like site-specific DNA recombinase
MTIIRYVIYARVSTKKQAGPDKTSIEEQLAYCHQWAAGQGLARAETQCEYVDAGITGRIREGRPAFVQMLSDAQAGKFDVVLVKFGDRIGRKFRIIINALDDLEEAGVQYRDLNKNTSPVIDPIIFKSKVRRVDIGEKIINVISALMSEEEQDRRIERSVAGRRRAIEAGRYPFGRPPFGYDFEIKQLDSIGRIEKVLIPNPKYYRLLEELPDLLLEQHLGNLKVAGLWNKRGILTPENEKWQNGQVDRIRRALHSTPVNKLTTVAQPIGLTISPFPGRGKPSRLFNKSEL